MQTTSKDLRRVALMRVDERGKGRPAIRRYRLARVIDPGTLLVDAAAAPSRRQAPTAGVRAP